MHYSNFRECDIVNIYLINEKNLNFIIIFIWHFSVILVSCVHENQSIETEQDHRDAKLAALPRGLPLIFSLNH